MEDFKEAIRTPSIEQIGDFEESRTPELKQDHGVTLIPRPSDDPRDPLVCPSASPEYTRTVTDLCLELAYEQENWHRCCTLFGCVFWLCSTSGRSTQCQVTVGSLQAVYYTHRMASM